MMMTRTTQTTDETDPDRPLTAEELDVANARVFTPEEVAAGEALEAAAVEFHDWNDVPSSFASEDEEVAWWDTHVPSEALARTMRPVPLEGDASLPIPAAPASGRPPGKPVNVRFEPDVLNRLQQLATLKGTKYQTLIKAFVQERLYEEEKREHLIG
jgi:hypothetical protein